MTKISSAATLSSAATGGIAARLRGAFATRDFLFHDGRTMRRVKIAGRTQATVAAAAAILLTFTGYGAAQVTAVAAEATGLVAAPAPDTRLVSMERRVASMQARVATIRHTAQLHAARIEQRQTLLATALTGKGDAKDLALATLSIDPAADKVAATAIQPFAKLEAGQARLAKAATRVVEARYAATSDRFRTLGVRSRIATKRGQSAGVGAMGGPLIAATSAEASADLAADAQFRSLFTTWKKLDTLEQGAIAIPSVQPVQHLVFTSNFGIRSDPFRGTAAMHAGVDIPGPVGTPIYATADGIVSNADRQGGYGNMVEINHGKGIATRYGHLSRILVAANTRVKRGQLIALMGSTGRSTGPHLHYEVRIDGHAVNPIPFLTTADYLLAARDRAVTAIPIAVNGPAAQD